MSERVRPTEDLRVFNPNFGYNMADLQFAALIGTIALRASEIQSRLLVSRPTIVNLAGNGGAGKTTLSASMKKYLPGTTKEVFLDGYFTGDPQIVTEDWDNYDHATIITETLKPLLEGVPQVSYRMRNWITGEKAEDGIIDTQNTDFVIVEGVSALRPDIAVYADITIYKDLSPHQSLERGVGRMGEESRSDWEKYWAPSALAHNAKYDPRGRADIVFTG